MSIRKKSGGALRKQLSSGEILSASAIQKWKNEADNFMISLNNHFITETDILFVSDCDFSTGKGRLLSE